MNSKWFAGNFCPTGAKCSLTQDPLEPAYGPFIRELIDVKNEEIPFLAEIRQFHEIPPKGEVIWMKAEGQLLDMEEYITLYPIIGYMYGDPSSREVFPLPDLRKYQGRNYLICVKGGKEPQRP